LFLEKYFKFNDEYQFGSLSGVPEEKLDAFKLAAESWDSLIKQVLSIDQTYDQKFVFVTVEWNDGATSYHLSKTAYSKFPNLVRFGLI
jgi:hypothetical protein